MITWAKAILVLGMIVVTWAIIIFSLKYFYLSVGILALLSGYFRPLNKSIWMVSDVLVNVVLSGYHKTTVSSELGNLQLEGSTTGTLCAKVVNLLFKVTVGQDNHCIASIEPEDIHRFNTAKALVGFILFITAVGYAYY